VESAARDEHERSLREYLRSGEANAELEARIELPRAFLESMGLPELRRRSERYLMEGNAVRFLVHRESGELKWEMEVTDRG
jgi:hypothetical protein